MYHMGREKNMLTLSDQPAKVAPIELRFSVLVPFIIKNIIFYTYVSYLALLKSYKQCSAFYF
jgi:hypothetical protein